MPVTIVGNRGEDGSQHTVNTVLYFVIIRCRKLQTIFLIYAPSEGSTREEKKELGGPWQRDLMRIIGYLTATRCEDWTAVLDFCERASATEANAKEAAKALCTVFRHGNASQQLPAARLCAIMLRNPSILFAHQCMKNEFLDTLEGVLTSHRTSPAVQDRLLDVLAAVAYASPHSSFGMLWRKVKPAGMPDEGVPFSPYNTIFDPPLPLRSTAPPRPGYQPPIHPQSRQTAPPLNTRPQATPQPQPLQPQSQTQQQPNRGEREAPGHAQLQYVIPPEEDMRRPFRECRIANGNTALDKFVAFASPKDLREKDTIECLTSLVMITAQIPWATAGADRPCAAGETKLQGQQQQQHTTKRPNGLGAPNVLNKPHRNKGSGGESLVEPSPTTKKRLPSAFLETNEALKSVLRVYGDSETMERSPASSIFPKETASTCALRSSLAQLPILAETAEQKKFLKREQQLLESEIKEAEARNRELERLVGQLQQLQHQQRQQFGSSPSFPKGFKQSFSPLWKFPSSAHHSLIPSSNESTSNINPFGPDPRSAGSSSSPALGDLGKPPPPPSDRIAMISFSRRCDLQNKFVKEDRALSAQPAELAQFARRLFKCGICFEEMPDDLIVRPDPCGHDFCRECLRGHVTTRLNERRFPILCPTCTAGAGSKGKGKEAVGEVSQSLAQDLGLTDEQYSIWTEMEMVPFAVLVYCRKCQRTMFVARDEHEKAKIITCPLPDCNHAWCKQCQQSIEFIGPKHSCDGTSELDHLMKQEGWKRCPTSTCKTPIQKISGCNHMSCTAPACNTHFCYVCGGLIVRSALGTEIKKATSAHYKKKKCALFDVPN